MVTVLKNQRGQTSVEYLLLLAATFITAYIVTTGPVARFTEEMIARVKGVTQNIVRTGELTSQGAVPGQTGHPSSRNRLRPLHL